VSSEKSTSSQVLQEVDKEIGLDWYEILTKTPYSHPIPSDSYLAYWSTRTGKHLSLWNPNDALFTLFEKRIVYLEIFHELSHEASLDQASREFSGIALGQDIRICNHCEVKFNAQADLSRGLRQLSRDSFNSYLQRKACSQQCADANRERTKINSWQNSVKKGMLPDAEFDQSITWESVWERFGPYCYICGKEAIYNQKDLGLRQGTNAWKERWGDYRREHIDRAAVVEHMYPRSKGGTHTWDNVRIACLRCNLIKGDSVPPNNG
jgi:5-methylcytosine-specific restriction endonuclease McrA